MTNGFYFFIIFFLVFFSQLSKFLFFCQIILFFTSNVLRYVLHCSIFFGAKLEYLKINKRGRGVLITATGVGFFLQKNKRGGRLFLTLEYMAAQLRNNSHYLEVTQNLEVTQGKPRHQKRVKRESEMSEANKHYLGNPLLCFFAPHSR